MGRVQPCKISQSFPGFGLDMKYFAAPEIGVSCVGMATSCPSVSVLQKCCIDYNGDFCDLRSGDNRKSILLRSTLRSYGSSPEPGASSEL